MKMKWIGKWSAVSAASLLFACTAGAQSPGTTFDSWAAAVSADKTSPVTAGTGDYATTWTAPDGGTVQLVVQAPHPAVGAPTYTMPAVPAGADATPYVKAAIDYARSNGVGKLIIPNDTYYFKTVNLSNVAGTGTYAAVLLTKLNNLTIDCSGSTFVFWQNKNGIAVEQSSNIELTNVIIKYDLTNTTTTNPNPRLMTFYGTVQYVNGAYELVVAPGTTLTSNDTLGHLAEWDTTNNRYVQGGIRVYPSGAYIPYTFDTPTGTGQQTLKSSSFNSSMNGKTFAVLEDYNSYGYAVLLNDSPQFSGALQSHDITLDRVTINSAPGMGIVIYGIKRGVNLQWAQIIPETGKYISTEYDAIHSTLIGGDLVLQHNKIIGQADDAINMAYPLLKIESIDADGVTLHLGPYSRFVQQYDTLTFTASDNSYVGYATITNVPTVSSGKATVVLDHGFSGLNTGWRVRDMQLIGNRSLATNNTIASCSCHGILAQTPNTLVANNVLTYIAAGSGIKLLTANNTFFEGVGAINTIVQNNTVSYPGIESAVYTGMSWGGISLLGTNGSGLSSVKVNKWVNITGNTVFQGPVGCVAAYSSETVNVTGNSCQSDNLKNTGTASITGNYLDTISIQSNTRTGTTTGGISLGGSVTNASVQSSY